METDFRAFYWADSNKNPAGGCVYGQGFCISWQNGPLVIGDQRIGPNGAFAEHILMAVRDRLWYYQTTPFNCNENQVAISHIDLALQALRYRQKTRQKRGVEGKHEI